MRQESQEKQDSECIIDIESTEEPTFSDNFTGIWIDRILLENKELSLNEKVVYKFIHDIIKNGKKHRCWTSHNYLCNLTGLSESGIKNLKKRLKEKGYINWKTTAIKRGDSYIKVCEYFDVATDLIFPYEKLKSIYLDKAENIHNINKYNNMLVNTTNTNNVSKEVENGIIIDSNNFNKIQSTNFIDINPYGFSDDYISSIEVLERIRTDYDITDRESIINDYLNNELLSLSGRKEGFVPMYMDDAYYSLKEGNNNEYKRNIGSNILMTYFSMLISGKRASEKLFNAFLRCLQFDLKMKNTKYIQWYKR